MQRWMVLVCLMVGFCAYGAHPSQADADTKAFQKAYRHVLEDKWVRADRAFGDFLKNHSGSPWFDDARFWHCYSRYELGFLPEDMFGCFEAFLNQWPGSQWAEEAQEAMEDLAEQLAEDGQPAYLQRLQRFTKDWERVAEVVEALSDIGDGTSRQALLDFLHRAKSPLLKAQVVRVLEEVEGHDVEVVLKKLLQESPHDLVRMAAAEALGRRDLMFHELLRELGADPNEATRVRLAALRQLDEDDPSNATYFGAIATEDGNLSVVEEVVEILSHMGGAEGLRALQQIFQMEGDAYLQHWALRAISDLEGVDPSDFLQKVALTNPVYGEEAIEAMAGVRSVAALEHLVALSGNHNLAEPLRATAIHSIGDFESAQAVSQLVSLLDTGLSEDLAQQAVHALGHTDRVEAVPVLVRIAREGASDVLREEAFEALEDLDVQAARKALINLTDERD